MQSISSLLESDRRAWRDSRIPPEAYRAVLATVAPIFREGSMREAVPVTIVNDPGVLESRKIKVVDIAAAEHGMRGTGGDWDQADQAYDDQKAYAMWKNVVAPWREALASARNGGLDLMRQNAQLAAEVVREAENSFIVKGLGPGKGVINVTGIQTFASAGAWTTAEIAYKDIVTAVVDKLGTKKVPRDQAALLVSPARAADLWRTFSNTDVAQLARIGNLLPGGIHVSTDVGDTKAYVYAKTPTVMEYVVYQDLSLVPLPSLDEDERFRARVIGAMHVARADGVVEITSIDA